ncbi:MAG: ABC transporter permease [Clostridium sp.]|nr:ABC transporter permease [Clostridium sp.]
MLKYILKRILYIIPIFIVVSFMSFALMSIAPGDPAEIMLTSQGTVVTGELLNSVRHEIGLDQSFIVRYLNWLLGVLHGNFGNSYITGLSVMEQLKTHLPYTLILAASSMILTLLISIPLGIISAIYKNRLVDKIIRGLSFIGNSMPGFFVALLLVLVFSLKLNWFPILIESGAKSIVLPSITLAIAMTSKYIVQIRASVIEEIQKDYVKGARSRGVKEIKIIFPNVIRNIMITVVTLTGLSFGSLLGGTAVVESIFVWPGIGSLVLTAIKNRDYPIIQAYVLWMAVIFIVINLITDILYKIIDPRVKEV